MRGGHARDGRTGRGRRHAKHRVGSPPGRSQTGFRRWRIAQALEARGLATGDRIAAIGHSVDVAWAQLAGLAIIAEVPGDQLPAYLAADAAARSRLLATFRRVGVRAAVARSRDSTFDADPWSRVAGTDFAIALFGTRWLSLAKLGASEPDQLAALRARVGHPQVALEGDEAALAMVGAGRTNRRGVGFNGRDSQRSARGGARNYFRSGFMAGEPRPAIHIRVPSKQSVIKRRIVQWNHEAAGCYHAPSSSATCRRTATQRRKSPRSRSAIRRRNRASAANQSRTVATERAGVAGPESVRGQPDELPMRRRKGFAQRAH